MDSKVAATVREKLAHVDAYESLWLDEHSDGRVAIRAYVDEARERGDPLADIMVEIVRLAGLTSVAEPGEVVLRTLVRCVVHEFFRGAPTTPSMSESG